jgi:hypothetical protein
MFFERLQVKKRDLMLPFYEKSDMWHRAENSFYSLGRLDDELEVSLQITTPDDASQTQISIENVGESRIDEVFLSVVATDCLDGIDRGYSYERQERLVFVNLKPGKVVKQYWNNIPSEELYFDENYHTFFKSYAAIYVYLLSKKINGVLYESQSSVGLGEIRFTKRLDELRKGDWVKKWDRTYNQRLLRESKEKFERKICGNLRFWPWHGEEPEYLSQEELNSLYTENRLSKRRYVRRIQIVLMQSLRPILLFFLTRNILVGQVFWLCLICRWIELDE